MFSYLIGDEGTGRAVVVDPQRDVSGYLEDSAALGLHIDRVIETHFHADFLSGHLELAAATGAVVSYGSEAVTDFPMEPLADGQRLELGSWCWRCATPRATRRSRSASSSGSGPATPSPGACSRATRCSSATSAGPICFERRQGRLDR